MRAVTGAPADPYAKRKNFFKAGLREVIRPLAAAVSLHHPETLFNRASAGLLSSLHCHGIIIAESRGECQAEIQTMPGLHSRAAPSGRNGRKNAAEKISLTIVFSCAIIKWLGPRWTAGLE
jgi:hypothetical protein